MMKEIEVPIITPDEGDGKDDSWEQIVDCIKKETSTINRLHPFSGALPLPLSKPVVAITCNKE